MTNFKKQIVSAAAAGAMLFNVAVPAFASTEIVISGNGAGADSWATVNQVNTTTVSQSNTANVTNNVDADADTGDNDANFNTGGNTVIGTGNATTDVDVNNNLNRNAADVDCCDAGDTKVDISGNGAYSNNGVTLNKLNTNAVGQNNNATVNNNIDTDADTGDNDAYSNTGGDVVIVTGNAKSMVDVSTTANVNSAQIGGGMGGANNPSASFVISGNGAGADNYITAVLANTNAVTQGNNANVTNDVDADADTGDNDANFNTGGDVVIDTGDATVDVDVDNSVNFNHADVDCGCEWDVLAKIAGNGVDTHYGDKADNIITLTLASTQAVGQGNTGNLTNDLEYLDADTGDNEANKNTGEANSDPAVVTGNATSNVDVSNSGNVNTVGDFDFDLPELPEVDFDFNMAVIWAWLGMSM